ncbi:S41 family peptidase [Streptomyces spiramenti]|uniref:Tricorn protease homolog n=1 Tax=Streptomyces spiramenti TaxID=2720606 RepID=A0ABX1ADQ3_9ACTN|nr:S41 family peptidase [Streptomyces spiramenti]NJP65249.1 peptidase S41 [Streptomyces spiramenti]
MNSPSYLRHPHLRGDVITFVAEDDVWAAPLDGGRAWRISADRAPAGNPRISPDGTQVAWTSTRDGEPEVHVASVDGGPARRLTYWGNPATRVVDWLPGEGGDPDEIIALTAYGRPSVLRPWAHAVPIDGSPARILPYGQTGGVALGPGGAALLVSAGQSRGRDAARWKRYRGGTAGKLWIDTDGDGEFGRVHQDLDGNLECPMWVGDRIAFLSDHEGTGAVYSSRPDGTDLRRHTPLDSGYARQAATDGRRVVHARRGELWILDDLAGAAPTRADFRFAGPRTERQPRPVSAAHNLGSFAPDHTGRATAVEARGTVHWVTHRDGPVRSVATDAGVRARLPQAFRSEDTDQVLWVTDAQGDDALALAPAAPPVDHAGPRLLAAGALGRVLELRVSPDGSTAAVASHDGRLLLVDLPSGEVHELDRSGDGDVDGLTFSPDSRWLAWSHPDVQPLRQIRLAELAQRTVHEVTPARFKDFSPAFTRDGKHLAFLSERTFDPVYDAHVFDLGFSAGGRPHLLTLAADALSPFGPQRHGRPNGADDEAGEREPGATNIQGTSGADAADAATAADNAEGAAAAPSRTAPPTTRVDLDGLADRVVPFPVDAASCSELRASATGVLWLEHPVSGVLGTGTEDPPESRLRRYDLTRRRAGTLTERADAYEMTGDGLQVVLRAGGKLRAVPADSDADKLDGDDDRNQRIDLGRVRITVDPAAEWRQMFDECGRLMRDNFWRADMGGVDWEAVLAEYRPLVEAVGTHDDLTDLLWEVVGELYTSHAYIVPAGRHTPAARRQGLLGADISRHEDGTWRVDRVLPTESSDPHARSPLTAPGVAVRPGDALVAVDGRPVDPVTGVAPLLAGTADQAVELTVEPAGGGPRRQVVVVPVPSEEALRYQDLVRARREEVRRSSGGRLGYLHVPDMMGVGWAQLHRDLRTEIGRDGLVVDVRENRGGHTSQLVIEKLSRRVIGWDLIRGARPVTFPAEAPRGPMVALCDEFSGSDGDIVTASIKRLGLAPVIGTRTWGGVVGIDGRYSLVDGTHTTQPKYAIWLDGPGWEVENYGVEPDVEVPVSPQDWVAGRDPQLEEALRTVLAELERVGPMTPPSPPEIG